MQATTDTFTTSDGNPILERRWTPDDGNVRGVVQILHGLAEHCGRYARLAEALTGAGFAVIAHDHRGHGGSVRDERDRGHFADHDGWSLAVDDVATVASRAQQAWPGVPLVLFGHSMGSTIALHALMAHVAPYDAVVLSGITGLVGPIRHLGGLVTRLERRRLGRRGRSKILHAMSFGDFNKAFEPSRTEYDWLSRDPAEVDGYANDPLCGFIVTTQHWHDHLIALGQLGDVDRLKKIPSDLPIYIFVGSRDPVSGATRQIDPFMDRLKAAGLGSVDLKVYPEGRHEMINDVVREQVTQDMLDWLQVHLPGPTAG